MKDNAIVKTLDLRTYKNGVGNRITRLLFDTAILLYVDRFCPERLAKTDSENFDQFLLFAFVWAYSLRAQYHNLGWSSAQNYITEGVAKDKNSVINSFNIYKMITEADSPASLISVLSDRLCPLTKSDIKAKIEKIDDKVKEDEDVFQNYLHYFKKHHFMEDKK